MPTPRLLLIDAQYVVRRIYEANPAPESIDKADSCFDTTRKSLRRALRTHAPTHCLLAFDAGGPTWRHARYPEYKAGRKPMPAPLLAGLPRFKEELSGAGLAHDERSGFEADDILGSMTHLARRQGFEVIVLASDKDVVGLNAAGAKVYEHFSDTWHDTAWCQTKFGLQPSQIPDWLALVGDSVDAVPGVPSIGAKTATKLLQVYGSLTCVLAAARAELINGAVGKALRAHMETAKLSRELVQLDLDMYPETFDFNTMKISLDGFR